MNNFCMDGCRSRSAGFPRLRESWLPRITAASLLVVEILSGCGGASSSRDWDVLKEEIRRAFPTVLFVSSDELADWLKLEGNRRPLLLDARSEQEFEVSHLEGAQPASSEQDALKVLEAVEKDRRIVVYCSVGYRSAALAKKLQDHDFRNVHNLEGSIFEWANQGRPLYHNGQLVSGVHPYDEEWGRFLNRNLWSFGEEK